MPPKQCVRGAQCKRPQKELSELKEDALRRATCLSGASGQRCEFHASCEDEHRDAHKSFDKHIIKVWTTCSANHAGRHTRDSGLQVVAYPPGVCEREHAHVCVCVRASARMCVGVCVCLCNNT